MKHRYAITYTDKYDDICPIMTWHCRAFNTEHAEILFHDSDDEGWKIISIKRVKE